MAGTMTEYYVVLNRTKLTLPKNIRGKIWHQCFGVF
jgi:hypothetical protein